MAAATYQSALELAETLTRAEKLQLISVLETHIDDDEPSGQCSIMELQGLGKELWQDMDAQEYVNQERASWDK